MSKINHFTPAAKIDLSWLQPELQLYSGLLKLAYDEKKELEQSVAAKNKLVAVNENSLKEVQSENDLLSFQLQQTQEAFKELSITGKEETLILNQKEPDIKSYSDTIAQLQHKINELEQAIAAKSELIAANENRLKEVQSENDLLLLQLHQVQEAFECNLINSISNEKFEQQKVLTKLTQEKLNSANEKYRKVTAQVQVLKDQLFTEQNSLCHKLGYYCEKEANGFWRKLILAFTIKKIRKVWLLESNKANS